MPEGKDQLVIWVTGGRSTKNNTCIYFDNVKVTSNNNAPSISIENNLDFENAPYVSAYVMTVLTLKTNLDIQVLTSGLLHLMDKITAVRLFLY